MGILANIGVLILGIGVLCLLVGLAWLMLALILKKNYKIPLRILIVAGACFALSFTLCSGGALVGLRNGPL